MLRDNIPAIAAVQGLRDQLKARLDQNEDFRAWQALERAVRELEPRNNRTVSVRGGVVVEPRSVPTASVVAHVEESGSTPADEEPVTAATVSDVGRVEEPLSAPASSPAQEKVNFLGRGGLRSAFF
jgi:hypothetical protein